MPSKLDSQCSGLSIIIRLRVGNASCNYLEKYRKISMSRDVSHVRDAGQTRPNGGLDYRRNRIVECRIPDVLTSKTRRKTKFHGAYPTNFRHDRRKGMGKAWVILSHSFPTPIDLTTLFPTGFRYDAGRLGNRFRCHGC